MYKQLFGPNPNLTPGRSVTVSTRGQMGFRLVNNSQYSLIVYDDLGQVQGYATPWSDITGTYDQPTAQTRIVVDVAGSSLPISGMYQSIYFGSTAAPAPTAAHTLGVIQGVVSVPDGVSITGSNATLPVNVQNPLKPFENINIIGSYNPSTQAVITSGTVIAALATYNSSTYSLNGYGAAQAYVHVSAGTSPSGTLEMQTVIPNEIGLASTSTSITNTAGYATAALSIVAGAVTVSVANTSSTNSMTVDLLGIGVQ